MPDKRDHRYFFVHVMKTAGTTLRDHIKANFRLEEIYPIQKFDGDLYDANMKIRVLLGLAPERKDQVRIFMGHFPYAVVDALGIDLVTMTLLRHPVERTLSYLRHAVQRHPEHKGKDLEEVYDDPMFHLWLIRNHQSKVFSLGPQDRFEDYLEDITVDERRLDIAKENLSKVGVLGLTERFPDFLRTLETDYGWEIQDLPNANVSESRPEVRPSFLDRIAEENAMDMAFYEYAVGLWRERNARLGAAGTPL